MRTPPRLETERLVLRAIDPERDFEPFAAMLADPETARFIGGVQERPIVWRNMCAVLGHWQVRGYGFFAVEETDTGELVGRVGPWYPDGWPAPEVGWMIRRDRWGKGYAVEAATAALDWAFDDLGWRSVVHVIEAANTRSIRVAEKLGSSWTARVEKMPPPWGQAAELYGQTAPAWQARRAARAQRVG
jgi:RimJ/RimL family protein N-acetyltransferase